MKSSPRAVRAIINFPPKSRRHLYLPFWHTLCRFVSNHRPFTFTYAKRFPTCFFFHSILRLWIHTHTRERAPHTSTGNRFVTRLYKNYPRVIGQLQFADSFSSDNTGRSTRATVRLLFDVLFVHIIPRSLQARRATLVSVVLSIAFSSSRVSSRPEPLPPTVVWIIMQTRYVCGRRKRGSTAAIAVVLCATCLLNAAPVVRGQIETTAVPDVVGGGGPQLLPSLQPPMTTTTAQHQAKYDDSANTELLKQVIRKFEFFYFYLPPRLDWSSSFACATRVLPLPPQPPPPAWLAHDWLPEDDRNNVLRFWIRTGAHVWSV